METLEPTPRELRCETVRNRPTRPALMIEPSWQRERQELRLTSWVRRRRIATGCR